MRRAFFIVVALIFLVFLSSCIQPRCGNNVCEPGEKLQGSSFCPQDCLVTQETGCCYNLYSGNCTNDVTFESCRNWSEFSWKGGVCNAETCTPKTGCCFNTVSGQALEGITRDQCSSSFGNYDWAQGNCTAEQRTPAVGCCIEADGVCRENVTRPNCFFSWVEGGCSSVARCSVSAGCCFNGQGSCTSGLPPTNCTTNWHAGNCGEADCVPPGCCFNSNGFCASGVFQSACTQGWHVGACSTADCTPILEQPHLNEPQIAGASVSLTWLPLSTASKYAIYRSSGGPFSNVANSTSTSYVDLLNSGTYLYYIKAVYVSGNTTVFSNSSNTVSAMIVPSGGTSLYTSPSSLEVPISTNFNVTLSLSNATNFSFAYLFFTFDSSLLNLTKVYVSNISSLTTDSGLESYQLDGGTASFVVDLYGKVSSGSGAIAALEFTAVAPGSTTVRLADYSLIAGGETIQEITPSFVSNSSAITITSSSAPTGCCFSNGFCASGVFQSACTQNWHFGDCTTVDCTPIVEPPYLAAPSVTGSLVSLNWIPSGTATRYAIYRSDGGPFTNFANSTSTTYIDLVRPGTYSYNVRSIYVAANTTFSNSSNTVSAVVSPAPTTLSLSAISSAYTLDRFNVTLELANVTNFASGNFTIAYPGTLVSFSNLYVSNASSLTQGAFYTSRTFGSGTLSFTVVQPAPASGSGVVAYAEFTAFRQGTATFAITGYDLRDQFNQPLNATVSGISASIAISKRGGTEKPKD